MTKIQLVKFKPRIEQTVMHLTEAINELIKAHNEKN